ncbi:MAG TPA: hypothetical protein EYQ00_08915, partial [Dehalococcoidia bacterium]|nr:hypothetical protein [Dehalococcoidia bacterium]
FQIEGLVSNLLLLREIIAHPDFEENRFHTRWLEQDMLPVFELEKNKGIVKNGAHRIS